MKGKHFLIPLLVGVIMVLPGCIGEQAEEPTAPPTVETPRSTILPSSTPTNQPTPIEELQTAEPGNKGTWIEGDSSLFIVDEETNPVILSEVYDGKTRAEYEVAANGALFWADGVSVSPSGDYALFSTNRNCYETQGMSVFRIDCKTGEESLLFDGADNSLYTVTGWWLDEKCAVIQSVTNSSQSYLVCDLDGERNKIDLKAEFPIIIDFRGDAFVFIDGAGANTANFGRLNINGTIKELYSFTPAEGFLMGECKIAPSLKTIAFKVREDYDSFDREIILWDTESNKSVKLPLPEVPGATEVAVADLDWSTQNLSVNFSIMIDGVESYMPFEWVPQ